jgi:hypothetical protein
MTDLLNAAATTLDDGGDPFSEGFLAAHEVTFDECMSLAGLLATGARLVAYPLENPGAAEGSVRGANTAVAYQTLNAALAKWRP